jgi:hypothetical protein
MKSIRDVADFVGSIGGHAHLRSFTAQSTDSVVCVYSGTREVGPLQSLENAFFVEPAGDGWTIGFSQYGRTRILTSGELESLLIAWIAQPCYEHFRTYEGEAKTS